MTSICYVGADSLTGRHFLRNTSGLDLTATTRRKLELQTAEAENLIQFDLEHSADFGVFDRFEIVVIAAAMTARQQCEDFPDRAYAINVDAPARIAERVWSNGGKVIFLSTQAVLGGKAAFEKPDAAYAPRDVYAETKARAEQTLLDLCPQDGRLTILRLTKLLSAQSNPVKLWLENTLGGYKSVAFSDVRVAPIDVDYYAASLLEHLGSTATGIFHLSGDRDVSYADIVKGLSFFAPFTDRLFEIREAREESNLASKSPLFGSLHCEQPCSVDRVLKSVDGELHNSRQPPMP